MDAQRSLPGTARRVVARSLPGGLLRRVDRARRTSVLTAVVWLTDDNAHFAPACVAGLFGQSRPAEEVLLAVVGVEGGEAARAARALEEQSWRVRRLDRPGAPRSVAFGEGARLAGGDLLMFCDAGEVLEPGTLEELTSALATDRRAELAGARPTELGRARLGDLVVRVELWRRAALTVPDEPYGEWWTAARLVLAARRVGDAPHRRRTGERRGTGAAFGTQPVRAPYVSGWVAAVADVMAHQHGADDATEAFLGWLLAHDVVDYLDDAERCTAEQWADLAAVVRSLTDRAGQRVVADLPVEARLRLWLAAEDRRADLARHCADRWLEEGQFPTQVEDGRVRAVVGVPGPPPPDEVLALAEAETPLRVVLRGMTWTGPDAVELELFAYVPHLGWDAGPAEHRVTLTGPRGLTRRLPVRTDCSTEVNQLSGDRFADHSAGVLRATLADASSLLHEAVEGDRWVLHVESTVAGVTRSAGLTDADLRSSAAALPPAPGSRHTLRPRRAGDGRWGLVVGPAPEPPTDWQVEEVVLEGARLVVRGRAGAPGRIELRGSHASPAVEATIDGDRFEAAVPLLHDPWRLGERPLPTGTYRFHLVDPGRPDRPGPRLPIAPALAAATPRLLRSEVYRLRLQRGLDGAVLVTLAAPLADDEIGPLAQRRLQQAYLTTEDRVDPATVYLQSYTGQVATDSPLAIHHELRRQRPDLRLVWAVADRAPVVPEGGHGVLVRSREWYDALATAGHLVTNIDMDRWFAKRPGQRLLQTFHGYPAKTMGIAAWEAKNFTPLRIERQLRRTSGTWDLLLTPTPAMDEHYRREYRYDGPILAAGYPRDDILLGPDVEGIRAATRNRLGIGGRTAVLYAPTWRDDLATNFRAADLSAGFDVEAAAEALGDDYVILLRGHRFHRQRDVAAARLLDVTDYPEINDLVLAADVAVLDYSSLRFDFALTGRPMVFLVPDLHRYTGGVRGFLFDFAGSAPGPLLDSTEEVVEALRDLDGLVAKHAEQRARFAEEFNGRQDGHAAERVVREFFGPLAGEAERR